MPRRRNNRQIPVQVNVPKVELKPYVPFFKEIPFDENAKSEKLTSAEASPYCKLPEKYFDFALAKTNRTKDILPS